VDYIVISGVAPWDGRYEFDLENRELTTREWGFIKRLAGYLPLDIDNGLAKADPELFCVFALIALRRAGKVEARDVPSIYERLTDAPFGSTITLEAATVEEDDAGPPEPSSNGSESSSGESSSDSSETLVLPPKASGIAGWASSESRQPG
jgi:hypothetical protein